MVFAKIHFDVLDRGQRPLAVPPVYLTVTTLATTTGLVVCTLFPLFESFLLLVRHEDFANKIRFQGGILGKGISLVLKTEVGKWIQDPLFKDFFLKSKLDIEIIYLILLIKLDDNGFYQYVFIYLLFSMVKVFLIIKNILFSIARKFLWL